MKTHDNFRRSTTTNRLLAVVLTVMFYSAVATAQEQDPVRSLFKSDVRVTEMWVPEVKINSIQGTAATLIGFYGGAVFNRSVLLGISGGANLSHPTVNYGYFGGIGQYIYKPSDIFHFSVQLLIAWGSAKDYENPDHGLLENFMNISGARFFMIEPGANLELNVSKGITIVAGMSYRFASGLDENNENILMTHLTNKDLSGIDFNIGVKFSKERKSKGK